MGKGKLLQHFCDAVALQEKEASVLGVSCSCCYGEAGESFLARAPDCKGILIVSVVSYSAIRH